MTLKAVNVTHREKKVCLGTQPRNIEVLNRTAGVFIEGRVEDYDEDGGEGSDSPTRSFLRRRLDEQSQQVEQIVIQKMNSLLEVIRSNGETRIQLLKLLVSRFFVGGHADQSRQFSLKGNLLQAEVRSTRLKTIDLEKNEGSGSRSDGPDQRVKVSVDIIEIQMMIDSAMKKGPKFPKFIHPYPAYVEKFKYPKGFKIPGFSLFAGELSLSSLEHVAQFTAQCGDVNNDFHKLRLFNFSLAGSAFAWYINLPPNSIQSWLDLLEKFHDQFYRPGMEMSVSSLARMAQASDESPMDYLTRFKSARNWCRVPLPEVEFVRLALNGLDVEYKKKFLRANFRDMYELAQHVEQYDHFLLEEKISKSPSR
ncbi:hypothetical protein COP2_023675 [Malus domestica]